MEECKVYRSCKYGAYLGDGFSCCNYMIMTGRSRCRDPKGDIKNGKCGHYARKRSGTKDSKQDKK